VLSWIVLGCRWAKIVWQKASKWLLKLGEMKASYFRNFFSPDRCIRLFIEYNENQSSAPHFHNK